MKTQASHAWDLTPKQAIELQQTLRSQVITEDTLGPVQLVAGVDVGFEASGTITRAGVAVLGFPDLTLADYAIHRMPTAFPYIPGLLSFREVPAVLAALEKLALSPDLLLVDGQGIAHPRRFGLACHLGLLTGLPAIGIAKTRLVGEHADPADTRGAWTPLLDRSEVIGAVLRTRAGVKPIYVSPGHRVSLATAIDYAMACTTKYRLPETTRWAHRLASGPEDEIARALGKAQQPK